MSKQFVSLMRRLALFLLRLAPASTPPPSMQINNIAITGYMGIGDLALFLPVIIGLRRRFSTARIFYLTKQSDPCTELLKKMDVINDVISSDPTPLNAISSIFQHRIFDLLISEHHFPSLFLAPMVMKIPLRVGIVSGGEFLLDFDFFFNKQIQCRNGEHVMDRNVRILKELQIPMPEWPPAEADHLIQAPLCDIEDGAVFLHPLTSKHQAWKRWPMHNYVELCKRLNRRVVVVGSKEEGDLLHQAFDGLAEILIDPPLSVVASLLHRSALTIGGDSGIAHLAALMGARTLVLVGPSDENLTAPRGGHVRIMTGQCEKRPCFRSSGIDKIPVCAKFACMESIRLEEVLRTAFEILGRNDQRRSG